MLNIASPINQLGYGIAGLNICKVLNQEYRASLFPIGQAQCSNATDAKIIQDMIDRARFFDYNAPVIKIWHQNDLASFVGRGLKIGFPIFELNAFSKIEKHSLAIPEKMFVCSKWAKEVMVNQTSLTDKDVFVVPLGVDRGIFRSSKEKIDDSPTIFFNCGKWEVRKGHDVIVEAFNKAFTLEDNVELVMMCENPFFKEQEVEEWEGMYKNSKLGQNKIHLLTRVPSQQEVYNIMANVDCGVFPARAEGWNLELLEMMACGKHVITTDYSGHTEFCTKENSMLVSIDKLEAAYDGKWFHGDIGEWAALGEDQVDQIVDHMRAVHRKKQEGTLEINQAGIDTAKEFSWANTGRKITEALDSV